MRNIQSYADIETARDKGELTPAEEELITCCREGRLCELNHGTLPTAPNPAHNIGADLLRYLITGGCDDCLVHDSGVMLVGAYVANPLDLNFATAKGATTLNHCHFEQDIQARNTRFEQLSVGGSHLRQGLYAQGVKVAGDIFLNQNLTATGTVDFAGADIGGQLNCTASPFNRTEVDALNAQGAKIAEGVFLSDGFTAKGPVDFTNADIGGPLICEQGSFVVKEGIALRLQDSRAKALFWRKVSEISGELDLNGAHLSEITDDPASWNQVDKLNLTGLTYDHLTNPGDTGTRLQWLGKGDRMNGEFSPQPYTQLAKVLRGMGHDRDARAVLIEGEIRHRRSEWVEVETLRANRSALRHDVKRNDTENLERHRETTFESHFQKHFDQSLRICIDAAKDHPNRPSDAQLALARKGLRYDLQWFNAKDKLRIVWLKAKSHGLRYLVGYGYKPFNSLWTLVILVALAAGMSQMAWRAGDFAPNSDVILSTTEWQTLAEDKVITNPARAWSDKHGKGRDYESFNALAYGFDLVVPIVNIGQEVAWAPSTTRGAWGWNLWWMRWGFTVIGWIVTALGAAAIAGVIRRD